MEFFLVMIDFDDVKDFDDVVYVELDFDVVGGWIVMVVIVDVVYYVWLDIFLDVSVFDRGNLCYFLDCVVLMLFEYFLNNLCLFCF